MGRCIMYNNKKRSRVSMNQMRMMKELIKTLLEAQRLHGDTYIGGAAEAESRKIFSEVRRLMGAEMQEMVNELLSWKTDIDSMKRIVEKLNESKVSSMNSTDVNVNEEQARGDVITHRLLIVLQRALEEVFKVMKDYPNNVFKVKVRRGDNGGLEIMEDDSEEDER